MKGKDFYLRLFEPEDYEKTYKWHTDWDVQQMTAGTIRFVSKEIERKWVYEKATNNSKDIYLAICLNDTDEMVGYISLNDIDMLNRSVRGVDLIRAVQWCFLHEFQPDADLFQLICLFSRHGLPLPVYQLS